ncbi:SDR family NAD(P)-dependent oxidoreductase [Nocardia sp. NPDC023852]|uniref:SDR family NAD(P)-dependent oxidoreductase n=1 Tax=Nocardia sp. NPDC023852 TaxID=3154697 RepID=UPI003406CF68
MSTNLLLEDKNAVIYGAGGAIGHAVARTFAREGARVFLAGRTASRVETSTGSPPSESHPAQYWTCWPPPWPRRLNPRSACD